MMSIEVNGEYGQINIYDSETSDFSDWTGYENSPFARTDTTISVKTSGPINYSKILLKILTTAESDVMDFKKERIFIGSIMVPSGKIRMGDAITETYIESIVKSIKINLSIYVDVVGDASQVDIIIEGDIFEGVKLQG